MISTYRAPAIGLSAARKIERDPPLAAEAALPGVVGCSIGEVSKESEHMKHWWQGWSVKKCFLFLVLIILLGIPANVLANSTHSSIVQTFVRLGVSALILWAFWILRWNALRVNDSPKKSK